MTSPVSYEPVFAEEVFARYGQLPRHRQRQIFRLVRQLASQPFVQSDYRTQDDQGRSIENLLLGDFVLSYWLDHANREVRIVEIEDAS